MSHVRSPGLESLEARRLFSVVPVGLTPAQIRHAYAFDQIAFGTAGRTVGGHAVAGDGSGQTIAVVDAFDDPYIYTDLRSFDHQFRLTDWDSSGKFVLTKTKPQGAASPDAGWALETALDVEWAHAMAPKAHILLVETKSDALTDLLAGADYARRQPGVVAVSMSWGTDEFPGETQYDSILTTPAGHIGGSGLRGGETFVTSSGDNGAPAGWPAVSPDVVSVGGTTLKVDAAGNYKGETAWSDSGGGYGLYESVSTSAPTVAFNADPISGYAVYDSYESSPQGPWRKVAGTSAGSPQWAALIAIADQGRGLSHKGSLETQQTLNALFRIPESDFHQILTGDNGGFTAGPGYNMVTGLGTPIAYRVVQDLVRA